MPRGDRTGPWGMGARTGRGAGYCSGYSVPGYANPAIGWGGGYGGFGRGGGRGYGRGGGFGMGRGGGRGYRHWYYATGMPGWQRWGAYPVPPVGMYGGAPVDPITSEQELSDLKQQADYFQNTLNDIRQRIESLESEDKEQT